MPVSYCPTIIKRRMFRTGVAYFVSVSVFDLMRQHRLNPKRSLSQNFLVDETHLDRIIEIAELSPRDTILEIGPGLGVLTQRLAEEAGQVF